MRLRSSLRLNPPRIATLLCWLTLGFFTLQGCANSESDRSLLSDQTRSKTIESLREAMRTQPRYINVHAAEALLSLGYPEGVKENFLAELETHGDEPEYRVVVWRVLARSEDKPDDRKPWLDKIWSALSNPDGPDRIHAAESLAKVSDLLTEQETSEVYDELSSLTTPEIQQSQPRLATYAQFGAAATANEKDRDEQLDRLMALAESKDPIVRRTAAYCLRLLGPLDAARWKQLVELANAEPASFVKTRLLSAALVCAPQEIVHGDPESPEGKLLAQTRTELLALSSQKDKNTQREILGALAEVAQPEDMDLIIDEFLLGGNRTAEGLSPATPPKDANQDSAVLPQDNQLNQPINADVRIASLYAILRLERRKHTSLHFLDWVVIAFYGFGMVAVGVYYARRTKSSEDYLLGGRNMAPWMVGLSLFASLMSTNSFLAYPGEVIRYGLMILGGVASFPIVYLLVGYFLIPRIMQSKVTSGYELLEQKLGLSIRLAGAFLFLILRLMWMATIIYATVSKVLLPVLGVGPEYSPLLCAILGVITLLYTSLGGLRAVVVTDVIQTLILIGGAVVTILLITNHFGGLSWIPDALPSHWPEPRYVLDPNDRMTFGNAMIAMLTWYICTAGSDQMAIQRYLATPDVRAARRTLGISMIANSLVLGLLALVGLAVMSFFLDQPHELPEQGTVTTVSDQLFSRFILIGLPVGLTGLVVSGLMAAAMSSLSSGVNSSSSVISEDFFERLGTVEPSEKAHIRRARWISVGIGVVAVLLSFAVEHVPGNLMDVVTRMSNMLTPAIFVLFFMALFVPWATSFGTWMGLLASVISAVAIAFVDELHISVYWMVPGSLLCGILVAPLASLAPIGKKATSERTE